VRFQTTKGFSDEAARRLVEEAVISRAALSDPGRKGGVETVCALTHGKACEECRIRDEEERDLRPGGCRSSDGDEHLRQMQRGRGDPSVYFRHDGVRDRHGTSHTGRTHRGTDGDEVGRAPG